MTVDIARPRGWSPARTHSGGCDRPPRQPELVWLDCPTCWGQGRILEPRWVGYAVMACGTCLGVGQVARVWEVA